MDISVIMNKRELYNAIKAGYIYLFILLKCGVNIKSPPLTYFSKFPNFPSKSPNFVITQKCFFFTALALSLSGFYVYVYTHSRIESPITRR